MKWEKTETISFDLGKMPDEAMCELWAEFLRSVKIYYNEDHTVYFSYDCELDHKNWPVSDLIQTAIDEEYAEDMEALTSMLKGVEDSRSRILAAMDALKKMQEGASPVVAGGKQEIIDG